ncbi:YigZ family protein [Schaalia sp. ZJ405]|uniref:YigZ family protein n=1 Tax=Schaalia sp. ZJ405 TaxID=2709403 RepID=UPI0013EC30F9|nr:YigZ family protein [Schaalia sp. ZJ405]QPK80586.1 YigZ family protein [Schaalia sp. ZJ405]
MSAPTNTIAAGTHIVHEIEIKRSRFITTLARTDSPEDARALIDRVKAKHPQARHNCSAFLIEQEGRNAVQHFSDDGEPSGTAGQPMIEALRLADVWNVTAVVTRYFGGILLGGGGLIRAYSSSVSEALARAPRAHLRDLSVIEAQVPVAQAGRIEAEFRARNAHVLGVEWADQATLRLGVDPNDIDDYSSLLQELTSGVTSFRLAENRRIEVDGPAPRI